MVAVGASWFLANLDRIRPLADLVRVEIAREERIKNSRGVDTRQGDVFGVRVPGKRREP